MKTKKNESKIEVLTDMKKITVENARARAEQVAHAIKKKYKNVYTIPFCFIFQYLVEFTY